MDGGCAPHAGPGCQAQSGLMKPGSSEFKGCTLGLLSVRRVMEMFPKAL